MSEQTASSSSTHDASTQVSRSSKVIEPMDIHDAEAGPSQPRRNRWRRYENNRFWLLIRGPRPKQDLKPPSPLLDIDVSFKGRRIVAPIESTFIRKTKYLSNIYVFAILLVGFILGEAFLTRAQSYLIPADSFIACDAAYWKSNGDCGLNGAECGPFTNNSLDFRCPAQCSSLILQNPRTVGNEQATFVPLIVGGGDSNHTFRGDSFICAAAVQEGIISDSKGGCGTLELIGDFTNFIPSSGNGLSSIGFPTSFPSAYRFSDTTSLTHCEDIRDPALAYNVLITCLLFFIIRPKPLVLFWSLFCIGFWHITLWSEPRAAPPLLSDAFGDFLPALFVAYGFWRVAIRFTLPVFQKAPIEAAVWYLAPFWTGVLSNLTFAKVPIDRLTAGDLHKRSGAIVALVIIIIVVTFIVINQVRIMRKTGDLLRYLKWYVIGGLLVLVLAMLPGLELRLHHYIIAMVLMPLTAYPTRLCAIYQGFLIGLFLNGVAAFGFDSMLQTAEELRRDAAIGTDLPTFLSNSSTYNASIPLINQTLTWSPFNSSDWDGFSLLVDDVERYVGTALNYSLSGLDPSLPHFFRLAFTSGANNGDYCMPATIWPNGTFQDPLPGPS